MGLIVRILTRIRQQLLGGGMGKPTNFVTWVLQSLPIFLANFDSQNLKFTFSIFGMSYFEHGMPPHPYETIHCNVWLLVTLSKLEWWERWVGVVWCVAQWMDGQSVGQCEAAARKLRLGWPAAAEARAQHSWPQLSYCVTVRWLNFSRWAVAHSLAENNRISSDCLESLSWTL